MLHQIGAGSVGPVFRGEDGETRQRVVIKVIRVGLTPEKVALVAQGLARLRTHWPAHPGLAPLVETGVVDVEPYVVTPWVDGDSLDVALREYGPAHMADALPRLRRLAEALDTAAAAGTAHGSLHLRDIIVAVEHTVLTGLGLAPVLESVGVRPPVRRPYCAPEVAAGGRTSARADQYALAAIAHEWLSGRRLPGSGVTGFQVPAATAAGADALRAVFARALDEQPERRFDRAVEFVEALEALAGHAPPRAVRAGRRAGSVAADAPRLAFDDHLDAFGDESPAADRTDALAAGPEGADDASAPDFAADVRLDTAGDIESGGPVWDDPGDAVESTPDVARDSEGVGDDEGVSDDETAPPGGGPRWDVPAGDDATGGNDTAAGDTVPAAAGRFTWMAWALTIAAVTLVAFGSGWALLRWSTPSVRPAAATSSSPAPAAQAAPQDGPVPSAVLAPGGTSATADARSGVEPRATTSAAVPAAPTASASREAPAAVAPASPPARSQSRPAAAPAAAARRADVRPTSGATPAGGRGRLLVRSAPAGAEVFVNGERRGVTPLALRDLPLAAYSVRLVHAGFAPSELRVVLNRARPARALEVALRPGTTPVAPGGPTARPAGPASPGGPATPAAPGSLRVESRPAGARVFVDGRERGTTPLTVADVAAGTHAVRLERPGYQPISTTVRVEARSRARVAVSLTVERPDR